MPTLYLASYKRERKSHFYGSLDNHRFVQLRGGEPGGDIEGIVAYLKSASIKGTVLSRSEIAREPGAMFAEPIRLKRRH